MTPLRRTTYALLPMLALACAGSGACAFIAPFPDAAPDPSTNDAPVFEPAQGHAFGDVNDQRGIAIKTSGDVVVMAGQATGDIDLGEGVLGELGNAGKPDTFLASFTDDGAPLWSKRFSDMVTGGVAIAAGGDVVIAGSAEGDVDFGGGVLPGQGTIKDIVIARYDAQGAHLWSRRLGKGSASAVAVDATGNSVITGAFSGKIDLDGIELKAAGQSDGFVALLDPTGEVQWATAFGDNGHSTIGGGVTVDSNGDVLLTGSFEGQLAPFPCADASETSVFVVKLDKLDDGQPVWCKVLSSTNDGQGLGIAADGAGNVLVTGSFRTSIEIGQETYTSAGDKDIFLAKLDDNGVPLWSRSFGDDGDQEALGVACDPAGNALVTGWFLGSMAIEPDVLTADMAADGFVAKLDPGGAALWSRSFGDASAQVGAAVDADLEGHVWATGYFSGSVDFGGGPLKSAGANDAFLVRLTP